MLTSDDLASVVAEFIERLPPTIGVDAMLSVLIFAYDIDPVETEMGIDDYLPTIKRNLLHVYGTRRFGATLRVIAVLDHELERALTKHREAHAAADRISETPSDLAEQMKSWLPSRITELGQAEEDWRKLRATVLSRQALSSYEDRIVIGEL